MLKNQKYGVEIEQTGITRTNTAKMELYSGNEYEKMVLDYLISDIIKQFNIKTKKEARKYLFNALAMNVVRYEINQMIESFIEREEK